MRPNAGHCKSAWNAKTTGPGREEPLGRVFSEIVTISCPPGAVESGHPPTAGRPSQPGAHDCAGRGAPGRSRNRLRPAKPCKSQCLDTPKPVPGLIEFLLSQVLAWWWLGSGYHTACQSKGRRPDSGSGRVLEGARGNAGRRKPRNVAGLGGGRLARHAWEPARRGVVGTRHAGFGHSLRKTQMYGALTKRHSGFRPALRAQYPEVLPERSVGRPGRLSQ